MKNVSAEDLATAIRNAHAGKPTISAEIKDILESSLSHSPLAAYKNQYGLSARKKEVLSCMVAGMSNAEISRTLVISLSTVKYHVSSIFTKLEASNRAEAVSTAIQKGLVEAFRKTGLDRLE
jgi:DNA-binding NarL/FixJ family response regulator